MSENQKPARVGFVGMGNMGQMAAQITRTGAYDQKEGSERRCSEPSQHDLRANLGCRNHGVIVRR